ncbi:TPA: prepilin-type N-terminal cleavage/methylation domain-containing protein [Salmonella enterica subsp. salamae serovar 56:l,v:z39]|nr:prepilin-type N-terminal cleavage/methylation domain-containing protein [Salmonella enterica subsp. salamae serovar 56:l,v:z39]
MNQRGLTLIEAAMVLALSAIVISGVMYYYNATSESYQEQQTMEMVENIISKVNALYASAPSTEGLTTAVIATQIPGVKLRKQDGFDYIEIPGSKGGQLSIQGIPHFAPLNSGNFGVHSYAISYINNNFGQLGNSQYDMCMAITGGQFGNAYLGTIAVNNPKVRAKTGGPLTLYPNENTVNARASFCDRVQRGGTGGFALLFNAS